MGPVRRRGAVVGGRIRYGNVVGGRSFLRNVGVRIPGDAAASQKNATLDKKHATNITQGEVMYARRNPTCLVATLKPILFT